MALPLALRACRLVGITVGADLRTKRGAERRVTCRAAAAA